MTLPMTTTVRIRTFQDIHRSGCFVIPNPWDIGSARLLAQLGFKALATTSSGFAWSQGRPDNAVSLDKAQRAVERARSTFAQIRAELRSIEGLRLPL